MHFLHSRTISLIGFSFQLTKSIRFLSIVLAIGFLFPFLLLGQHMDPGKMAEHTALHDLLEIVEATHVAVADGDWSTASNWDTGTVPGDGAKVYIPSGRVITYDVNDSGRAAPIDWIRVNGSLHFASATETTLYVETIATLAGSVLEIGTASNPVTADCRIIITHDGAIDTNWDYEQLSRGIVTHGTVRIHGQEKLTFSKLSQDAMAGSDVVHLEESVNIAGASSWQPGDQLVITGTELIEDRPHLNPWMTEDEERTVVSVSADGKVITLDASLSYDHTGRGNDILGRSMHGYVGNYSRTVRIETENPTGLPANERGHVMFMHNPDVDVRYAEFHELGRTDKSIPLDDFLLEDPADRASKRVLDPNGDPVDGARTNIRGRYSFHFHRTGAMDLNEAPAMAVGNAIWGGPGWGMVHHDSHAHLIDNVTYDIFGTHITTETSNEIGVWERNLTVKTPPGEVGSGKGGHNNHDIASNGSGFWLQGRLIHLRENVAVGMRTAGFQYFTRGVDQISPIEQVLDLPMIARYEGKTGSGGPQIQEFRDNVSLACYDGLKVIKHSPSQGHGARSHIAGFTVWETKFAVNNEYTAAYTFSDNTYLRYEPTANSGQSAVKLGNTTADNVFVNCRVVDFGAPFYWNGSDTHTNNKGVIDDYGFKFIDMDLVNTPAIYDIRTNGSAQVTDPNDHIEILSSSDLNTSAPPALVIDEANSNFDFDAGAVVIQGTLVDSVGTFPHPGPRIGEAKFASFYIDSRIIETGYWTDAEDPNIAIFTVEEVIEDRATEERLILEFPVTWGVNNMPAEAVYNGVWSDSLMEDDFDGGFSPDWTSISGVWQEVNGKASVGNGKNMLVWTGDGSGDWTDYELRGTITPHDNDTIGLVFRYVDSNNYYFFGLNQQNNITFIDRVVNGSSTRLASVSGAYTQNQPQEIALTVSGSNFAAEVNGTPALEATDSANAHASGSVGLRVEWMNPATEFDNISVLNLSGGNPPPSASLTIEAEGYDNNDPSPFQAMTGDPAASGSYMIVPNGSGNDFDPDDGVLDNGILAYDFDLLQAGDVTVWIRYKGPTAADNSLWYQMDAGGQDNSSKSPVWSRFSSVESNWAWRQLGTYTSLASGSHTFRLMRREDGVAIDQLFISTDGSTP